MNNSPVKSLLIGSNQEGSKLYVYDVHERHQLSPELKTHVKKTLGVLGSITVKQLATKDVIRLAEEHNSLALSEVGTPMVEGSLFFMAVDAA